jgi:hypothetical protein
MHVTGPFDATARGALKALGAGVRRCEKPSSSSALGREGQNFDGQAQKSPPRLQVELVCQEGTGNFDPIWDAPRLVPTFVAQVMGQVMADRRDASVSVQTAYGSVHCPRMALLLDRKS